MIYLKTEDEIELMRKANRLVASALSEVAKLVKPGVTTNQLDAVAEQFIRDNGGAPTFKGVPNPYGSPFPASICTSVNDVIVHGVPNDDPLKEGDIVSVDCGALLEGFNGDSCYTFRVGEVSSEVDELLNYGKPGTGKQLKNGLCIAIEPMITMGTREFFMLLDRWGVKTRDGKASAHFEHTIAIHNGKPEILSSFTEIETIESQNR